MAVLACGGETSPPSGAPDAGTDHEIGENHVPHAVVVTPDAPASGDVELKYLLFDTDRDSISLTVEWSDDGQSWHLASGDSARAGLESSPDGVEHAFVWASVTDLGTRRTDVFLRVTPSDGKSTGTAATTEAFLVFNRAANAAPSGSFAAFPEAVQNDVPFSILLSDAEDSTVSVTFEAWVDLAWIPASVEGGNPRTLPASPAGQKSDLVWHSADDLLRNLRGVKLRAKVDDGHQAKPVELESITFDVNNGPAPTSSDLRFTRISAGVPPFFEVRNNGTFAVTLGGMKFRRSSGSTVTTYTIPSAGDTTVAPGATAIVIDQGGTSGRGTVYLGAGQQMLAFALAAPQSLELLDTSDRTVDFVRWGASTQLPQSASWHEPSLLFMPHRGAMLVRRSPTLDTDSSADFCAALSTRTGPPGPCLTKAPTGTTLRMTEIGSGLDLYLPPDPSLGSRGWVEVINDGPPTDLAGFVLHPFDDPMLGAYVFPKVTLGTGERAVVVEGPGTDGPVDGYQRFFTNIGRSYTTMSGYRWLTDAAGNSVDYIDWGAQSGPGPAWRPYDNTGRLVKPGMLSIGRRDDTSLDIARPAWCVQSATTPGQPNAPCRPPVDTSGVRLNEIGIVNPQTAASSDRTYIEIDNSSPVLHALDDYELITYSGGRGSILFLKGFSIGAASRLVLKQCPIATGCSSGSGEIATYLLGTVGSVELIDPDGNTVDFLRWGGSTRVPDLPSTWSDSPRPLTIGTLPTVLGRIESQAKTDSAKDWCPQDATQGLANGPCH